MSTYKVIQDIEAEDKLLGPLTLKQFIFAIIVAVSLFIAFRLALVNPLLAIPLIPHTIVFGFLAAPFGKDQPNEIWLAAKIRFFIKPRRRIWDQSGTKHLVTITAPKKIERTLVKSFTQNEVRSRLTALANTIDSRGWAVKNVNVNLFAQPSYAADVSDRLIAASNLPQEVSNADVTSLDDMFDDQNNPRAQQLTQMITASSQNHRQQLVDKLQQASKSKDKKESPVNYWFMNEPPTPDLEGYTTGYATVVTPGAHTVAATDAPKTPEEEALLRKVHAEQERLESRYGRERRISPISKHEKTDEPRATKRTRQAPPPEPAPSVTPPTDPAILQLATNDDLNVATLARQAGKARGQSSQDEVVISLH